MSQTCGLNTNHARLEIFVSEIVVKIRTKFFTPNDRRKAVVMQIWKNHAITLTMKTWNEFDEEMSCNKISEETLSETLLSPGIISGKTSGNDVPIRLSLTNQSGKSAHFSDTRRENFCLLITSLEGR